MKTLEDRIKFARKNAGFSQKKLSEKLGITSRTLQRYEKDASKTPIDIMTNISSFCDIDLIWLIAGTETSNLTKIVIEHQDLIKRFKNPEKAKDINERLIEIEELSDDMYNKVDGYIEATRDAARAIKQLEDKKNTPENSNGIAINGD